MGERVQIVLPPVVDPDTVTLSIRRPASVIRSLADYAASGAFDRYVWQEPRGLSRQTEELTEVDRALVSHLRSHRLGNFLELAVRERRNIAVVGETGSGKTTLMKTLCQSIPTVERLITIEDVRELQLPRHPNRVHLLYSKGEQGVAEVTPSDLIAASMRMKPDRVLLAELRGAEAFDYLKLLTTGHAGSITSFHAESCALAVERYVFMAKEHPQASIYDPPSLKRLVDLTIDVTLHVEARYVYDGEGEPIGKARYVSAVRFDPLARSGAPDAGHMGEHAVEQHCGQVASRHNRQGYAERLCQTGQDAAVAQSQGRGVIGSAKCFEVLRIHGPPRDPSA